MPGKSKRRKAAEQREEKKRFYDQDASIAPNVPGDVLQNTRNVFNCTVISGTLHQGDTRFQYPGMQCTYISFWALISMAIKDPLSWQADDVDLCVKEGNDKFLEHCTKLRTEPKMLLAKELPRSIKTDNLHFECIQSDDDIITGTLVCQSVDSVGFSLASIDEGVVKVLNKSKSCLLVCGGQTIAIAKEKSNFFIFDPHSRGRDGFLHPSGSAVIVVFSEVQCLISFIKNLLISSLALKPSELFELVPIIISKHTDKKQARGSYFLKANHNSDQETCTGRTFTITNEIIDNSIQGVNQHKSAWHDKAIESYFIDQEKRDKEHRSKRERLDLYGTRNRREYIRQYMHTKRKNKSFREQENISAQTRMKKVRATEQGKLENKVRAAEGMKRTLSSEEGRKKHNERSCKRMKKLLSTEKGKSEHNKRSAEGMKKMLNSEEGRNKHNKRSADRMKKILNTKEGRSKHNKRSADGMKKILNTEEGRIKHNKRSADGMKKILNTEEGRIKHNKRSADGMKKILKRGRQNQA